MVVGSMRELRPRIGRPSAPMLVALLALFVALGGPAKAARLIDGGDIRRGTVGSQQVADRSLKTEDLKRKTVKRLRAVPDGAVGAAELAENAVTNRALAPASVATGHVVDNSLTADDLAPSSVDAEAIADDAVGQAQIRNNGVGGSEIVDNAVSGGKIVDGSLTVRDVAQQYGTVEWPIDGLDAGACQVGRVSDATLDIAGDFVVVSPVTAWPEELVHTVNGTSRPNEFKLQACNRSRVRIAGSTYRFNYAVLGF